MNWIKRVICFLLHLQTARGMPSLPRCRFHACVNPVHEKPLIIRAQRAASEGMLVVVYFPGLCCFPFSPSGERRLSSGCLPLCQQARVGWSDAEGLFTVAPWGERDVK